MPTVPRILDARGNPLARSTTALAFRGRAVRGRYDAAESNSENAKLWAPADGLSARSANSPEVRRKLRNRARYEVANNSYAKGMVDTLAADLIGTGPRLQILTDDADVNRRVADEFESWTAAVGLAEKLRTFRKTRAVSGESFALMTTNPQLPTAVQLDLRLIEADQIATPDRWELDPNAVDGIEFDRYGNPAAYHLLHSHPGDVLSWGPGNEYDRIPADMVLHWFECDRPGQARGIPDITSALPLFALLRRFTLAVLAAAETAADFAAVLYSELPPDSDGIVGDPFEELEITRRMMTTLPAGYKMGQFRAEQPAATYEMFKREILNEIARCLSIPYNVAAGNSSSYNYASGRLDHQTYYKSIDVARYHLETATLDRLWRAWLAEARLATPRLVAGLPAIPRRQWHWDGREHVDPVKEANAQATRLGSGTTTLADEWARQGFDWREKARQIAEERRYFAELGIPYPGNAARPATTPADEPDDDGDEPADEDQPTRRTARWTSNGRH